MRTVKLVMVGLLFSVATAANAAPTWQGTSVYNFSDGVSRADINWQVYAPTDIGSPAALGGYTYVYNLSDYTGAGGIFSFSIGLPRTVDILGAGVTTPARAATLSPTSGTTASLVAQWSFGSPVTAGQTSGFYWASSVAPAAAGSSGLLSTVGTVGSTTALVMAPGAPEPATWALIFMAAGWLFFLYRRQEENVDEALVA